MRRTTIYLPDELHRRLRLLAAGTRSTLADLLRAAAEHRYRELFEEAPKVALGDEKPSAALRHLTDELRTDRYRRDQRFRWNRK